MKIAMMGFAGAGKKTLFKLASGAAISSPKRPLPGVFNVGDERVEKLSAMYNPKKTTFAKVDLLLMPDIEKTSGKAPWLSDVRLADGICLVVRAFEDPSVAHPQGAVNPARDIENFISELLFADACFLDQRKQKLSDEVKKRSTSEKERELALVERLIKIIEQNKPLSAVELSPEEKKILSAYSFLSAKPSIAAVNISMGQNLDKAALEKICAGKMPLVFLDAKLESEIAVIENVQERKEFLAGMGIERPAVEKLAQTLYFALGLISFFTVGEEEVRAWSIRKGSTAPTAARAIHSDLEKGFIRAELMKYGDLVSLGSEPAVKAAGKFSLKGKDYIVEDGDVLTIRSGV
ncbi:MAG: DUF933 domain-containing protein [Elusimicrobia bacterium]|nr:DUF933 domain-containing protein [Elusimicrobiota bacterium]